MGIESNSPVSASLADALFPKVRQRVLLALSEAGLLLVSKHGNQKHYQANASAPVFSELRGLVLKTMNG